MDLKNTIQWQKSFDIDKIHIGITTDAAGLYCKDKYTNTKNGQFYWGISHVPQSKINHGYIYQNLNVT